MTNEEIENLKKKIETDPQPSLSILLAEEYRKNGLIDEAIQVLQKVLKNRPDYTSARVALGKIYLQRDMLPDARMEFEKAVSLIPDNLLAHKKLAEIYCKQEDNEKALQECQVILNLHPDDDETKAKMLSLIEPEELQRPSQTIGEPVHENQPDLSEDSNNGLSGESPGAPSDSEERVPVYEIPEESDDEELEIDFPRKITPVPDTAVNSELKEFHEIMKEHSQKSSQSPAEHKDTPLPEQSDDVDVANDDKIVISMPTKTMADIFIDQGLYNKALDVYNEILSSDPENKKIFQKREELKMLLKIIGNK
jgi:tetratricopeptide (TPR) repeat protein